jgi:hypothetical protein
MLAQRLTAQLLAGPPARDAVSVVERLLAVQAQDARGFRLAIRARTRGVSAADVDAALGSRALVVTWLNRGTLHLVRREDYPWLHALTAAPKPILARLAQLGVVDSDRAVARIERRLADGPMTRAEAAKLTGLEGQAVVHVLALACARGIAVRGPMLGAQHAYVLVRDWLGEQPRVERDAALAELARRYLAGHAPADDRDLAKWAGLPLRDARAGLRAVGGPAPRRRAAALPAPRLLGAFEPVLLGWTSRDDMVGEHVARVMSGGMFRPFALVGGRAVATWRLTGAEIELEPFAPLADGVAAALERDGAAVLRFLGR